MRKKLHFNLVLISGLLLIAIILSSGQPAAAQGGDPEYFYYFPLFDHHTDPFYAFGLDGGDLGSVVIDPNNSNVLYARTWGNGVYKSGDGGETWINKSIGLESSYIYDIAIDPFNSDHIIISSYEHGVAYSLNAGETWVEDNPGLHEKAVVYSIDFCPENPGTVYVALREPTYTSGGTTYYPGGVFKSTDGGLTWENKSTGLPIDYVYDLAIDPNNPDIIYTAMHRTGVYKTTNGGESWMVKNNGLVHRDARSIEVDRFTGQVNVGLWDGYGYAYSTDGAASWKSVTSTNNQNLYVWQVQIDPNREGDKSVFLSTATGVYFCDNPRESTVCQPFAYAGKWVWDLALDVNGGANAAGYTNVMYSTLQHNGIFKSISAGSSFVPKSKGIRANIVNSILVDPTNPDILYLSALNRGLFKSTDGGTRWSSLNYLLPSKLINELAFRPGNSDVIYAGTQNNGLWISNNKGQTWFSESGGLGRSTGEGMIPQGEKITPDVLEEIYNWMDPVDLENLTAPYQSEITTRASSPYNIRAIGFDEDQPQNMFVGTYGYGVKRSENWGLNWAGTSISSGVVNSTVFDSTPLISNPFIVGLNGLGVRISSDRSSWSNTSLSSRDVYVLEVALGEYYLAGTDDWIYRAVNVNGPWGRTAELVVLPSGITVTDLQIDPSNSAIVWATTNHGLYRSVDSGLTWNPYTTDILNQNMLTIVPITGSAGSYYIGSSGGDIQVFTP